MARVTDEKCELQAINDGLKLDNTNKESLARELRQNLDIRNINVNEAEA